MKGMHMKGLFLSTKIETEEYLFNTWRIEKETSLVGELENPNVPLSCGHRVIWHYERTLQREAKI
jgi:hypothetical protein